MATAKPGVLRVDLQLQDLAQTRFAPSPLFETLAALRVLRDPGSHGVHLPWARWARSRLAEAPLRLPTIWPLLVEPPTMPEFLLPAPGARQASIADEAEVLQATTAEQVRACLARFKAANTSPGAIAEIDARPEAVLRAVAAEFLDAYELLIAPHWPRIQALLNADITYRAGILAARGAARMFADLHEQLGWCGDHLLICNRRPGDDRVAALGPGGLVLVPSVFLWPELWAKSHTLTQTTIRYPARGVALLWETVAGEGQATQACEQLLGRPRARLLTLLSTPGTTGELARRLSVTPSAVSQHLRVLRDAALLTSERTGRTALHHLTPLGQALLALQPPRARSAGPSASPKTGLPP